MYKLVYILAASHSGSTLLSMLLNSHPDIVTTGELKLSSKAIGDINRYRCSCGQLINQCTFWQKIKEGMGRRGYDFDIANAGMDFNSVDSKYVHWLLGPLNRGVLLEALRDCALKISPKWRKHLPDIQKRNAALISTILETAGAKVVADSSKTDLRLKFLLRNPELDIKVIHLIRDGRGVALTYMNPVEFADAKTPDLRAGGMGGNRDNERLTIAQAANQWKRSNEAALNVIRRVDKSRKIEIHYEQLCRDTENTFVRLFQFIGLDSDTREREFRAAANHVIGNGMRLDKTSEINLDERWRSALTKDELQVFNQIAGALNRRFGYE
ncbi:MAG: sulfotransferase [Sedimentisphaerales bacterium]|nr:sulfotransferase [Sedimentisphaerales bacterium]